MVPDQIAAAVEEAVKIERARCAKICDDYARVMNDGAGEILAAAILDDHSTLFRLLKH
jgi:hypothetical protein